MFVKNQSSKTGQHKSMKKNLTKGLQKACNQKIERRYKVKNYSLVSYIKKSKIVPMLYDIRLSLKTKQTTNQTKTKT